MEEDVGTGEVDDEAPGVVFESLMKAGFGTRIASKAPVLVP